VAGLVVVVVTGAFVVVVGLTGFPRAEDTPADAAASARAPTAAATTSRKMRRMGWYRQFGWQFLKAKGLKRQSARGSPLR
jgi:hypothetical protein